MVHTSTHCNSPSASTRVNLFLYPLTRASPSPASLLSSLVSPQFYSSLSYLLSNPPNMDILLCHSPAQIFLWCPYMYRIKPNSSHTAQEISRCDAPYLLSNTPSHWILRQYCYYWTCFENTMVSPLLLPFTLSLPRKLFSSLFPT